MPSERDTVDEDAPSSSVETVDGRSPAKVVAAPQLDARYEVLGPLGHGGMATVWRAKDSVLGREVAIKQLKPGAEVQGRMRFLREAQIAASLAHENVVQVFDFHAREDGSYLAMELVEGRSLRAFLEARGRLPWLLAAQIVHEVARALEYAHSRGVTHRDVKPENVLLSTAGAVKLSDFGIAAIAQGSRLTAPDALIGTPLYLAPERVRGDEPDARADVFSLGVTLYELVAGNTPWASGPLPVVLHAILHRDPAPLEQVVPGVDARLARLTGRCIARDPAARPRDAGAVAAELAEIIASSSQGDVRGALRAGISEEARLEKIEVPPARATRSRRALATTALAVLVLAAAGWAVRAVFFAPALTPLLLAVADFDNRSGDPELDALSGLLVTSLEQSRQLTVLTRSRAIERLRQAGKADVARIDEALGREACRQSGAQALVVGSVHALGGSIVIDAKLVDPSRGDYIFAATEQAESKAQLLAALDRLALKLRDHLRETSADVRASQVQLAKVTTTNLAAYRHYFEGEHRFARLEDEAALAEFQQAAVADPDFALAWYRVAYMLKWLGRPGAVEAAERAYIVRDGLPEKERLLVTGLYLELRHQPDAAVTAYRKVVARWRLEKEALFAIGDIAAHAQRLDEAERELKRALVLDGTYAPALQHMVLVLDMLGRHDEALEYAKRYVKRDATDDAKSFLADAHGAVGQYAEARAVLDAALESASDPSAILLELGQLEAAQGRWEEAAARFSEAVERASDPHSIGGSGVAAAVVLSWGDLYRGRTAAALARLDAAIPSRPAALKVEQAAWLLIGAGDTAGAAALADEVWPQRAELDLRGSYHLAVVLWRLGRVDQSAELVAAQLESFASAKQLQAAHEARAAGRFADCARLLADVPWRNTSAIRLIHAEELAECQERAGQAEVAAKTRARARAIYPGLNETQYGLRPIVFRRLSAPQLQKESP